MNLFNTHYDETTKELVGTHESGFYSCINCVRISLYKLVSQNILPEKVSFRNTLNWYKSLPDFDLYPILYKTDFTKKNNLNTNFNFDIFCPTALPHNKLELDKLSLIEDVYFLPSDIVEETTTNLISKYNIHPDKTLVVLHRGNDKWKEAQLSPVEFWIQVIEAAYEEGQRILIQTDEEAARQKFVQYFGDRCFFLEEMLFVNTPNTNVRPEINKESWAVQFESVMRIISKCKTIVNHTGNCALVPIVYRGSLKGEIQIFNNVVYDYDNR